MRQLIGFACLIISGCACLLAIPGMTVLALPRPEPQIQLLDSCTMSDDQEIIRLYYNPGMMDSSWWITYQADETAAELEFFRSSSVPLINGIECAEHSVFVEYSGAVEEISRSDLVQNKIEYYKAERSTSSYSDEPTISFAVIMWVIACPLMGMIGIILLSPMGKFLDKLLTERQESSI